MKPKRFHGLFFSMYPRIKSVPAMNDDSATPPVPAKPPRLDSLDALRGFDLFALTSSFFLLLLLPVEKKLSARFSKKSCGRRSYFAE